MHPITSGKKQENEGKCERSKTRKEKEELDTHCTNDCSLLYMLPDEVLLKIFGNLLEQDLCRLSRVCKRFHSLANDKKQWESLYKDVFEYNLPLLNTEKNQFNFHLPDDLTCYNPWKMSMSHIYHGLHVRPGYQDRTFAGRSVKYFSTVSEALDYTNNMECSDATLVFLHAGRHKDSRSRMRSQVALIGAAPGTVVESVVLCLNEFCDGSLVSESKDVYLGHITLEMKISYGIRVGGTCMFDHCYLNVMDAKGLWRLLFDLARGMKAFQMKHCVLVHPRDFIINISSISYSSLKSLLWVQTKLDAQRPLPTSCPWVRQGLDVTKHDGCKCIDVCGSPGVTGEHYAS